MIIELSAFHRIWPRCAAAAEGWMLQSVQSQQPNYPGKCDEEIYISFLHFFLFTTNSCIYYVLL